MKYFVIVFVIGLFWVVGCQRVDYVIIDSKTDSCKTLEIDPVFDQPFDKLEIGDVVDTMEVITLETTPASILSDIRLMKMSGNYIIIYDGYQNGNIAIFDINGKFIRRLTHGNGPGEINIVSTFDIDEQFLYTYQYEKINKYTLAGEFVESFYILELYNRIFNSIKSIDGGFLLSIYPCNSKSGKYEVIYTDKQFKGKSKFVFEHSVVGYGKSNDFKIMQGDILFFPPLINIVYRFDGKTFRPLYTFNYPKYSNAFETNPDCSNSEGFDFFRKHCVPRKFFPDGRINQSSNILYLTFMDGSTSYIVYLDINSGKFRSGAYPSPNDAAVWPLKYEYVECTYNDFFVQLLPPNRYLTLPNGRDYDIEGKHLEESVSQLQHISDEDKQKILNAKDDDNPLIIMYKLKSIE